MTQSVHLHQRRHAGAVAKVVSVLSAGEGGAGRGLGAAHDGLFALGQILADERECKAGKVAAAAGAANYDVGVVVDFGELLQRLFANDGLVQKHVVEDLRRAFRRKS